MLGNQPAWFGGRLRGKGPTQGHLAAQPTQYGTRHLTVLRFIELSMALGIAAPTLLNQALQRSRLHLQNLALQIDLRFMLNDKSDKFRPMHQWARNKLNENPDGVVELPPSSVKELATFVGCTYLELANYLARFIPEKPDEDKAC